MSSNDRELRTGPHLAGRLGASARPGVTRAPETTALHPHRASALWSERWGQDPCFPGLRGPLRTGVRHLAVSETAGPGDSPLPASTKNVKTALRRTWALPGGQHSEIAPQLLLVAAPLHIPRGLVFLREEVIGRQCQLR